MKRILSIQDLSCFGSSSLSAALPVVSAMGVECVVLPTALLSAHTFFPNPRVREMTEALLPFAAHWKQQNIHFDAICTGYLSSPAQAEAVIAVIDLLAGEDTLVFVDPAMGDDGSLYPGLSPALPEAMAKLCARAHVIVPNLTEARLLTRAPTSDDHSALLDRLLALGPETVLLTGVEQGSQIGVVGRGKLGELSVFSPRLHNQRPGTGDLFSAVCSSALVLGDSPEQAVALAERFVSEAIRATEGQPDARDYAVHFQSVLGLLCR